MGVSTLQIVCLIVAVSALTLALVFGVFRNRPQPPVAAVRPAALTPTLGPIPAPVAPAAQEEPPEELNARFEAMHRLHLIALNSEAVPPADTVVHEEIASKVR